MRIRLALSTAAALVLTATRAVETACRFPEAFESPVPREHLRDLLGDAVADPPADDPEVTACIAAADGEFTRDALLGR